MIKKGKLYFCKTPKMNDTFKNKESFKSGGVYISFKDGTLRNEIGVDEEILYENRFTLDPLYDNEENIALLNKFNKEYNPLSLLKETLSINNRKKEDKENSAVNHPNHYAVNPDNDPDYNIECIDAMIASKGKEKVANWAECNAFKYMWRAGRKENNSYSQDIKKIEWCLNKSLELYNKLKIKK